MKRFVVLLVFALVGGLTVPAGAQVFCVSTHEASNDTVVSTDGTPIAITVFKPAAALSAECGYRPVPIILTLHGWSGSRAKTVDQVRGFLDAGYGVIGIDARGHGESGGQALVMHPSREVNDIRAVIDYVAANVPWALLDGPGDPRLGASGGSYGGGFQLMTAAFDDRLDAIVPEITWNNLPQSLAPNGVIKSAWISLLYAAGKLSVDMDRRIDEWFVESMATNRPSPANVQSFSESSPYYWMQNIDVPALLVQGMPDTVFPLNEAVNNYIGIRNNGAPAWIVGHNSGHIFPGLQPTGVNAPARSGSPCGNIAELRLKFFDAFLKGSEAARDEFDARPRVTIPTEQGACISSADWPVNTSTKTVEFPVMVVPQVAGTQLLPLFTATEETTVAGIPTLSAGAPVELDDIFFLSLVLQDADGIHVVDDQVMGARTQIASVEGTYNVDLGGVATTMQPGDSLYLRVDGANEQYIVNGGRKPGAALLANVKVGIPLA